MSEHIYTIPVNEAFDTSMAEAENGVCRCPFCRIYEKLEATELDLILGASMMEPDVRQKTNEAGFCRKHFNMLMKGKNRLGLGLILESHLAELRQKFGKSGMAAMLSGKGSGEAEAAAENSESCYICNRIEYTFSRILKNAALLWDEDPDFKKKIAAQPQFCLTHYGMWLKVAKEELGKKKFAAFYDDVSPVMLRYFDELAADVSWFCKKFDYRYENEPWGNAKNAIERAADFLQCENSDKR